MEVDVTPGQCDGGHSSSQSARKSGRWDVHPSIGIDDRQVQEEDEWRSMIYNNRDLTKRGRPGRRRLGGKGERPLGCERSWGFQSSGEGSLLPRTLGRPILCVFPPSEQAVALSEPNFWTHSLQIHCIGSSPKTVTLQLFFVNILKKNLYAFLQFFLDLNLSFIFLPNFSLCKTYSSGLLYPLFFFFGVI